MAWECNTSIWGMEIGMGLGFAGREVSPKQRRLGSAKAYVSKIHMVNNEKRNTKLSCSFYICRHRQRYWNINTLVYISMHHIPYIDIKLFKVERVCICNLEEECFPMMILGPNFRPKKWAKMVRKKSPRTALERHHWHNFLSLLLNQTVFQSPVEPSDLTPVRRPCSRAYSKCSGAHAKKKRELTSSEDEF